MNEGFPVMVQKTLPVCLDRAWHLLASETGLKKLTTPNAKVPAGEETFTPLLANVRDRKRLSYISFWISGPDHQPSLVKIRFIPRMRHTTVKLTQFSVYSRRTQQLFIDFWQKRIDEVV